MSSIVPSTLHKDVFQAPLYNCKYCEKNFCAAGKDEHRRIRKLTGNCPRARPIENKTPTLHECKGCRVKFTTANIAIHNGLRDLWGSCELATEFFNSVTYGCPSPSLRAPALKIQDDELVEIETFYNCRRCGKEGLTKPETRSHRKLHKRDKRYVPYPLRDAVMGHWLSVQDGNRGAEGNMKEIRSERQEYHA